MPKSKIRKRYKTFTQYNPFSKFIVGDKQRQSMFGVKPRPVPGVNLRGKELSPYMGSRVTAENRTEYLTAQVNGFKEQYTAKVVAEREKILSSDKTKDEIDSLIEEFNAKQISEARLHELALKFSLFQANKEVKHYKAWLKGASYFKYAGQVFPVLTQRFLENSQSIKEIHRDLPKEEDNE